MDTMNKGDSRVIDRPVHEVSVSVGALILAREGAPDGPSIIQQVYPNEPMQPGDMPVILFALAGSNYSVTYTESATVPPPEPVQPPAAPEPRGDTDESPTQTGSYESRTVKELRALAKEKNLVGVSQLDKDDLIKALREA